MSKATTSPTARLLATSRLFSLPRPLPPPITEAFTSSAPFRASDSATLPYPTHQAITTPRSALHRGDFGLKRSLPRQATRTSTPHVRVIAQDTYEHITDFSPAADLSQNERKWAQMGIPITQQPASGGYRASSTQRRSVFEADLDNTDPEARAPPPRLHLGIQGKTGGAGIGKPMQRWKYNGPWVAGMGEGEFDKWLSGIVGRKSAEWREFVRKRKMEKRVAQAQGDARERREELSEGQVAQMRKDMLPSESELPAIFKQLRDDHARDHLGSELTTLLVEFLDLPAILDDASSAMPSTVTRDMGKMFGKLVSVDNEISKGPPTTHPAAGLSHLRSSAVMSNHPLYGPQAHPAPIHARVLKPREGPMRRQEYQALLGVGGFVTRDPHSGTNNGTTSSRSRGQISEEERMAKELDEDMEGGNKLWVHPQSAFVNEKGLVGMIVKRAEPEALAVKRGGKELEDIIAAKRSMRDAPDVGLRGPGGQWGLGGEARGAGPYGFRERNRGAGGFMNS